MTKEEKIILLELALRMQNIRFEERMLDTFITTYDLILEKQDASLMNIAKIIAEMNKKYDKPK